jgi:hypothetical protein
VVWLQIERSGFDSRRYQIFWEVMGLESGPLSLVSTIEDLLERKSSGTGLEYRDYGRRDPQRWLRDAPLSAKICFNFTDKRRLLGRYSSLAAWSHGVINYIFLDLWSAFFLSACISLQLVYVRDMFHDNPSYTEHDTWVVVLRRHTDPGGIHIFLQYLHTNAESRPSPFTLQ